MHWLPRLAFPIVLALLALHAPPALTVGADPSPRAPLWARSAILIDQATGRVLYEQNADQPFVPASLAKLMSLHLVYARLAEGSIHRDDVVSLTANAWAANQAPGSSLMNLGPGQIVTVGELMKGVAVASGNDAATALAEYVAGSTEKFVRLMNDEARYLGYTASRFTDPSGVGEDNRVTAREFADFCRRYIDLHPEALVELHSLREFEYPLSQNMPEGRLPRHATRKQYNGNYLVWDAFGVDGLKTGHLDMANFTAAITARRGDTRLIAVLLGVPGLTLNEGARNRSDDGMALLSYGFRSFSTVTFDAPALPSVRVWKGAERELAITPLGAVRLTARSDELADLGYRVLLSTPLVAPVLRGQRIGDLLYESKGKIVARIPLVAGADVQPAGLLRRAWDSVVLGISSLVRGSAAPADSALIPTTRTVIRASRQAGGA